MENGKGKGYNETMTTPKPNEKKITQVAGHILSRAGGSLNIMKLIKLMYFAEREAIIRWGTPITFDRFYSLPNGPVLSRTLDMINGENAESERAYWDDFISPRATHNVGIKKTPETGSLSDREIGLLDEIYNRHGNKDQWELREESHHLPEWRDPQGSALAITIDDILSSTGKPKEEIEEIKMELDVYAKAEEILGATI